MCDQRSLAYAISFYHGQNAIKPVVRILDHSGDPFRTLLRAMVWQHNDYDANRRQFQAHGQFAEILVFGQQYAPVFKGQPQDILIRLAGAQIGGPDNIKSFGQQSSDD